MSDRSEKKSFVQDVFGAVLFVSGAFLAFSIAMFWIEGGARDDANPTTTAVVTVIGAIGAAPGFALGLVGAVLGGLLFFSSGRVSLPRHVGGALGVLVGGAIVLGALVDGAGGALGGALGALLGSSTLVAVLGTVTGAFVVAVTVWSAWLPKRPRFSPKLGESNPVSAALREGDSSGVTIEEAAALLPVGEDSEPVVPAHPIDVRLSGGVPEGATPLGASTPPPPPHGSPAAERPVEAEADDVPAWAGGDAAERAGEDLAEPTVSPVAPAAAPDDTVPADEARADERAELAEEPPAVSPRSGDPTVRVISFAGGSAADAMDRPSWEQVDEEPEPEPERSAETPVAPAGAAAAVELEPQLPWEEDAPETASAPETPQDEATSPATEEAAEPEPEPEPEDKELEDEVLAHGEAEDDGELEEAEEEDDDAEAELEDEYDDEEEEDDEEYEYIYVDEHGEEIDPEDVDEESLAEDDELEDEEDDDAEYEDDEDLDEAAELEDEEDEEDQEDEEDEELEDAAAEADEPEVVVEPAPKKAPARAKSTKKPASKGRGSKAKAARTPSGSFDGDELRDAGLLIIERGRVAVSLFQREYDMDFKAATALLDELQERGLIGPYLGGRHRDILLTREEWLDRCGAASGR